MGNQYNEPNSVPKHITWINNTEVDLIANLDPCQAGIANDTHHVVMKDKDGNHFVTGFSGYSGLGFSGYSGAQGISGYSGYSGYSGHIGSQGIQGPPGTQGISGYSGISGAFAGSGSSGYLAKFTSASSIASSPVKTDGTNVGIGNAPLVSKFEIEDSTAVISFVPYVAIDSSFYSTMIVNGVGFATYIGSVLATFLDPGIFSVIFNYVNESTFNFLSIGDNSGAGASTGIYCSTDINLWPISPARVIINSPYTAIYDTGNDAVNSIWYSVANKTLYGGDPVGHPDPPTSVGAHFKADRIYLAEQEDLPIIFTEGTGSRSLVGFGFITAYLPGDEPLTNMVSGFFHFTNNQYGNVVITFIYNADPVHLSASSRTNPGTLNVYMLDAKHSDPAIYHDPAIDSVKVGLYNNWTDTAYISYWVWYDQSNFPA